MTGLSRASALTALTLAAVIAVVGANPRLQSQREHDKKDRQVSLESVLSAPFISELRVSPSGQLAAWLENREGRRNVIVADLASERVWPLTSFVDDGQAISGLLWWPDSKAVVFARGAPRGARGRAANPMSLPAVEETTVWSAPLDGGSPIQIGAGESPVMNPRGAGVAFVSGTEIAFAARPEPARRIVRGSSRPSSLVWSPVSNELAFVSERDGHSLIALVRPDRGGVEHLSPSVDLDQRPRWSSDARRLAFVRTPQPETGAPEAVSIMVAERSTLADRFASVLRHVWRVPALAGMPGQPRIAALEWLDSDRLIVGSDHGGWSRLYVIDVTAERPIPAPISPHGSEAEEIAIDPRRSHLFFTSNARDSGRRHLWSADLTPGKTIAPRQVTAGAVIDSNPTIIPNAHSLLLVRADGRSPAAPVRLDVDTGRVRPFGAAYSARYPASELCEPSGVRLSTSDGWHVRGELFEPRSRSLGQRAPAVLYLHGGPAAQTVLGWHPSSYYHHMAYAMNQYLASRGYLVLSINYRGSTGYGVRFRDAPGRGSSGASEYNDVLAAVNYLRARTDVDPHRVAVWGGSYGGYLATLALARNSDLFAAGVALHPAHDRTTRIASDGADAMRVAREASPAASLHRWRSPILLVHGDDDPIVEFSQSVSLVRLLRHHGIRHEALVLPGEVHSFAVHAHWVRTFRIATEFLDRAVAHRR